MTAPIENVNQEVVLISSENINEMKVKLFEIEQKASQGIATNDEINLMCDIIMKTYDYSDLTRIPERIDFMDIIDDISNTQSTGNELDRKLKFMDETCVVSNIIFRAMAKGFKVVDLVCHAKRFKKELESYFDLIEKSKKRIDEFEKKWSNKN